MWKEGGRTAKRCYLDGLISPAKGGDTGMLRSDSQRIPPENTAKALVTKPKLFNRPPAAGGAKPRGEALPFPARTGQRAGIGDGQAVQGEGRHPGWCG